MFTEIANQERLTKTIAGLKERGITTEVVADKTAAKARVHELLPDGVEVMTMTSVTLSEIGLVDEINGSDRYKSVKQTLSQMDRETQGSEMRKLGAAPDYSIGSVHAVTEDGVVVIASNTGSQLPAYAYGAKHVIWVVGTQKIVKDLDEAMKRIYDYVLPREADRARKAYGASGSYVSKLLIVNRENLDERIHLIFVEEPLGF